MRTLFFAALLPVLAVGWAAYAKDDEGCTRAPKEQWLSTEQLKAKLTEQGFTVSKVEIEDGCAEADAKAKDGKETELHLDPATGNVVENDD
ncbi:PepSY domain-containing protein [Patescibacteria group bacterium]|jgi:hypothetical protein|nr:PepSY domain-containing protein [Patescibacteria group bacterium]